MVEPFETSAEALTSTFPNGRALTRTSALAETRFRLRCRLTSRAADWSGTGSDEVRWASGSGSDARGKWTSASRRATSRDLPVPVRFQCEWRGEGE